MSKPIKVTMWKDLDGRCWESEKTCQESNRTILEGQEYRRKERIVCRHVDVAFDDWLKNTEQDKACDMRQGAMKMIWYFLNNDMFRPDFFDAES